MQRLLVVVEGQTEESFINSVLAPELWAHGVTATGVVIGVPGHKGGRVSYARYSKDVLTILKQDSNVFCSSLVDFYGLGGGFPGHSPSQHAPNLEKVRSMEAALSADIINRLPNARADVRFIPYIQLHEYEGLLFSDPPALATAVNQPALAGKFQAVRDDFATPEDINDSPQTAPSKRIEAICRYSKIIDGTHAAKAIGIERMRAACPHFHEWVTRLEKLSTQKSNN
ncbi:MAG: DUF4276 family protein [Bryobacteraceae bacterium]|nr:DUF4276 family protein [Bryobacteraceae bacterium]